MKKGLLLLAAICTLALTSCTCGNKAAQKEEAPAAAATETVEQTPVEETVVATEATDTTAKAVVATEATDTVAAVATEATEEAVKE